MRIFLKIVMCLLAFNATAYGAGTEGHGGDPIRLLFTESRAYAVDRILGAKACAFNVDVRPEVSSWIMLHQVELAKDVLESPHHWLLEGQSTCAFTQIEKGAAISFSFAACRPLIREVNDAISTLVHESAHHLGVRSESFADEVGEAISRLGQNCACNPIPSIDPFDPNSCPGRQISASELYSWIPLPSSTEKSLGTFLVSVRQRSCYANNFCTNWKEAAGEFQSLHFERGQPYFYNQVTSGKIKVQLRNNRPEIVLESDPSPGSALRWGMVGEVNELQKFSIHQVSSYPEALSLRFGSIQSNPLEINARVAAQCFQGTAGKISKEKDAAGNDVLIETEMAILSSFTQ